jgi:hypothetical protein
VWVDVQQPTDNIMMAMLSAMRLNVRIAAIGEEVDAKGSVAVKQKFVFLPPHSKARHA